MSRAFVKEDVDVPERLQRRRSASGLPPGALNLMTAEGAERLQQRISQLKEAAGNHPDVPDLEATLASATVVTPPESSREVVFGMSVRLKNAAGLMKTCRIVGVDEVDMAPGNISWVSPSGKTLLGARRGQSVRLGPERESWVVEEIL